MSVDILTDIGLGNGGRAKLPAGEGRPADQHVVDLQSERERESYWTPPIINL